MRNRLIVGGLAIQGNQFPSQWLLKIAARNYDNWGERRKKNRSWVASPEASEIPTVNTNIVDSLHEPILLDPCGTLGSFYESLDHPWTMASLGCSVATSRERVRLPLNQGSIRLSLACINSTVLKPIGHWFTKFLDTSWRYPKT